MLEELPRTVIKSIPCLNRPPPHCVSISGMNTCSPTSPPISFPMSTNAWTSLLMIASKSSICCGSGSGVGAGGGAGCSGGSMAGGCTGVAMLTWLEGLVPSNDIAISSRREVAASSLQVKNCQPSMFVQNNINPYLFMRVVMLFI
jgi:hypothetical protein